MAAFSIQGTQVLIEIPPSTGGPVTAIPGVTSFTLGQGERNSIPTTSISSTSEEKLAGFTGAGTFTMDINWDPGNGAHADLFLSSTQSGTTANRDMSIVCSDAGAAAVTFTAFVTNFELSGSVNEPGKITVTMELAAAFTITP